jgi:putative DNA methylase
MRDEAEKRIGHLYPKVKVTADMANDRPDLKPYVGKELTVIAWVWARTVASPNPAIRGAHVPLVRSFWLSSKRGTKAYMEPVVDRLSNTYSFAIRIGTPPSTYDPKKGTVVRTGATCLISDNPIPFDHIRAEGKAGRLSSCLMAIVAEGSRGRVYLPALDEHAAIAKGIISQDYPDTDLPKQALSMRVMLYGMDKHYKLFTQRQLTGLVTFSNLVTEAREKTFSDATRVAILPKDERSLEERGAGACAYADSIATYLAFLVDQMSNQGSMLSGWYAGNQQLMMTFSRQALAMVWDYAESNPFCESTGSYHNLFERMLWAFDNIPSEGFGFVDQADASAKLIAPSTSLIVTDPPYYDNIGYADLSDYFYAWLRRSLHKVHPTLLSTLMTPKVQELLTVA